MRVRSAWYNGTILVPTELDAIDQKLSNAVSGQNSSPTTYSPSSPIVVGGAGVVMGSPLCEVQSGAAITVSQFSLVSNVPKHPSSGWTRTLRTPIGRTVGHLASKWYQDGTPYTEGPQTPNIGLGRVTPYVSATRLRVHHGARLTSVRLTYQCGVHPYSLATALEPAADWMHVYRTEGLPKPPFEIRFGTDTAICTAIYGGNKMDIVRSTTWASTIGVDTIVEFDPAKFSFTYQPPVVDIVEMNANGDSATLLSAAVSPVNTTPHARQTRSVGTVNQFVDARQNTYFARIVAGNYLNNVFESVELTFDSIADMRPQ